MQPAKGVTLTIDSEVISDEAVVYLNGGEAVATIYNPNDDPAFPGEPIGPERVGRLVNAKEYSDPQRIVGTSVETGLESTWVITKGRGCRNC